MGQRAAGLSAWLRRAGWLVSVAAGAALGFVLFALLYQSSATAGALRFIYEVF